MNIDIGSKLEVKLMNGDHFFIEVMRWEQAGGTYWFLCNKTFDVNTATVITDGSQLRLNAQELGIIPICEIIAPEEYQGLVEYHQDMHAERQAMANVVLPRVTPSLEVAISDTQAPAAVRVTDEAPNQPQPVTEEAGSTLERTLRQAFGGVIPFGQLIRDGNGTGVPLEELRAAEPVVTAEPEVLEPAPIPAREPRAIRFEGNQNSQHRENTTVRFSSIPVGSKAMVNIAGLAEEMPDELFELINASVNEIGHMVFTKLNAETRQTMIDLKIKSLNSVQSIDLDPGKIYELKFPTGQEATMMHVGADIWYVPVFKDVSEELNLQKGEVLIIHRNFMKNFEVHIHPDGPQLLEQFKEELATTTIPYETIITNGEYTVEVKNASDIQENEVTAETLGAGWVKAIGYHYITGGEFSAGDHFALEMKGINDALDGAIAIEVGSRIQQGRGSDIDKAIFEELRQNDLRTAV